MAEENAFYEKAKELREDFPDSKEAEQYAYQFDLHGDALDRDFRLAKILESESNTLREVLRLALGAIDAAADGGAATRLALEDLVKRVEALESRVNSLEAWNTPIG